MFERLQRLRSRWVGGTMPCWVCGLQLGAGEEAICWELHGHFWESEVLWACSACDREFERLRQEQAAEIPLLGGFKNNADWEKKFAEPELWRKEARRGKEGG